MLSRTPLDLVAQTTASASEATIARGVEMLRSGRTDEALKLFDAALVEAPRSSAALTWRGICENQTGAFSAAAKDLRAAIHLDPAALSAHYNLALSLIRLHNTDGAIDELERVVSLQPEAVPARYNLAVLLEEKGQFAKAVEQLRAAHLLAMGDAGVALHLLEDMLRLGDASLVPELTSVLTEDAATPEMRRQAGAALVAAGHFPEATTLLRQARQEEPTASGVTLLLARAYVGAGRNAEAVALLDGDPAALTDEEMVYTAGLASLGLGDLTKAAARFKTAATLDANDGRPLYHLGLLAEQTPGGAATALELLQQAVALDRGNRAFALGLARLLLATDKAEAARTLLEEIPVTRPDDVERSTLLGVSLASTNAVEKAVPLLQHALKLDPQLAVAHNVLGFCFFRQGAYAQAAAEYHLASDLEQSRLLYAEDAALAYERAAQQANALRYAERAASLPGATPADKVLLGKLYEDAGRREEAIGLLRQAAATDPDLDSAYYLLARIYQRMGDRAQAAEWNAKLQVVKQRHEAAFVQAKRNQPERMRSSRVLAGGTLTEEEAATP